MTHQLWRLELLESALDRHAAFAGSPLRQQFLWCGCSQPVKRSLRAR